MLDAHEKQTPLSVSDSLATASTYIAESIRRDAGGRKTLVTGGGVFNLNLMRLLEEPSSDHMPSKPLEVMVPEVNLVRGKEAHAFAFLGLLRLLGLPNVWPEFTGSKAAHVGGALWGYNAVSSRTPNAMQ
jgi:anhydro-N-acetylmuramic acid kinase